MNEIMLSIRPKWCELIASGRKTIEVRKTKPKCDMPFKVYIYCTEDFRTSTKDRNHKFWIGELINGVSNGRYLGNGKVIGEFVCDKIHSIHVPSDIRYCLDFGIWSPFSERLLHNACITPKEALDYAGNKEFIFGWHISDLKIYDEPKQLGEFCKSGKADFESMDDELCKYCADTNYGGARSYVSSTGYHACEGCFCDRAYQQYVDDNFSIVRPPQSWCYVEKERGSNDE